MLTSFLTLLLVAAVDRQPVEFEEVNDLPAPTTAPVDESVRYEQLADRAARIAQEAAEAEDAGQYQQWYEYGVTAYYAPANDVLSDDYGISDDTGDGISAAEFKWRGVVEDGEHFYTWYSERTLPGYGLTELNENGRWSDGEFVRDGDGYIAVASCDHEKGEVIETPWGAAKVYDTGYLQPGQIDVYTSF